MTAGIEEMVVNDIVVPEPGKPVIGCWDRAVFKIEDVNQYPKTYGPTIEFGAAWSLDYMQGNPQFVVGVFQGQANNPHSGVAMSGYSEDGGRTWQQFAFESFPYNVNNPYEYVYGSIAVSSQSKNKMIWHTVGNAGKFLYSHDMGANWQESSFSDGVGGGTWNRAHFFYKKSIVADPVDGDTFYAFNWQNKKVYRSTDGGKSFSPVGSVPAEGAYHCKLRAVPGRNGHLFYTDGINYHDNNDKGMGPLWESKDGGVTWIQVPDSEKIIDIAFGAPRPGNKAPTFIVSGKMGVKYGIFLSHDEGANWEYVSGLYPMGVSKGNAVLAADPGIYRRVYIGSSGIGYTKSKNV